MLRESTNLFIDCLCPKISVRGFDQIEEDVTTLFLMFRLILFFYTKIIIENEPLTKKLLMNLLKFILIQDCQNCQLKYENQNFCTHVER